MAKPDTVDIFAKWLAANGAEVLAGTNPYEILRFRSTDGIGIVYENKAGRQTFNVIAKRLFALYKSGGSKRLASKKRRGPIGQNIRSVAIRDGWNCFFCGCELDDATATIEHICSVTHGGPSHIANYALSCEPCNLEAGHLAVVEKIKLREQKRAPTK